MGVEEKTEAILRALKKHGCRITKQRRIILSVILEKKCCCSKEIYYQAAEQDPTIGLATVYRLLNTLEEVGAINRCMMYHIEESWLEEAGIDCGNGCCEPCCNNQAVCEPTA